MSHPFTAQSAFIGNRVHYIGQALESTPDLPPKVKHDLFEELRKILTQVKYMLATLGLTSQAITGKSLIEPLEAEICAQKLKDAEDAIKKLKEHYGLTKRKGWFTPSLYSGSTYAGQVMSPKRRPSRRTQPKRKKTTRSPLTSAANYPVGAKRTRNHTQYEVVRVRGTKKRKASKKWAKVKPCCSHH
jgi:hypothetical protein